MRILLLGAAGQLGQTFLSDGRLAARGKLIAASRDGSVPGVPSVAVNLADAGAIRDVLDAERPNLIVNAAAYTAVDRAEDDETQAIRVNADAVAAISQWAVAHASRVVHYSTDYVFSGDASAPYAPDAPTAPQGAYGRSKLAGEAALRDSGAMHLLFRTAWVYSTVGHNFLKTMLRLGAERDTLRVVADQHGTPTTAALIVSSTLAALDVWQASSDPSTITGTYHLTASGSTTWHGFAEAIFDEAVATGVLPRRPFVEPITTEQFPTPARRPAFSVLDNRSFVQTFGHPLPDWRAGLRETMAALGAQ
ncbi:dTDP-4-dehydrorhamnose reductase [Luteibacter sp.]|uniref:dTDP-4-dehydrorhamnose reductase n=1 Tax=Luteibacter sp. TaxID=1886636 RepID=UPI003F819F3B